MQMQTQVQMQMISTSQMQRKVRYTKCSLSFSKMADKVFTLHLHFCLHCLSEMCEMQTNANAKKWIFSISCISACACICITVVHTCICLHLYLHFALHVWTRLNRAALARASLVMVQCISSISHSVNKDLVLRVKMIAWLLFNPDWDTRVNFWWACAAA